MYLDSLSLTLKTICKTYQLSQEALAERCSLSTRYMGKLIRRRATPTLRTLEKICTALSLTPDQLLLPDRQTEAAVQVPMPVTVLLCLAFPQGSVYRPLCPRCHRVLGWGFPNHCGECGQLLDWSTCRCADEP